MMDLALLYYEQKKFFIDFADFRQVKIISHFFRLWAGQDYWSFLQTLGKSKTLTKLL